MDHLDFSLTEAKEKLDSGDVSSVELTQSCLKRIEETEDILNAFITVTAEQALKDAEQIDTRRGAGQEMAVLAGIPIAHKDLFMTEGVPTSAASQMLADYAPPYSATVVERCADAGTVMIGKTNCDEFAQGSSGENSKCGDTRNPWDTERVPGGSSSGSAAAVAARQVLIATGTDTGGSIRYPASFCNLVGLKPTYGAVSRYGVIAMASSLDCPSISALTVADAQLLFSVIKGADDKDATSQQYREEQVTKEVFTIGVPREYMTEQVSPEVRQAVQKAITELENLGHTIQEVSLPHTQFAIATYYVIATAEVSSNLARYDGIRYGHHAEDVRISRSEGFGDEAKRRIILGTFGLSAGYADAYYHKATAVRSAIRKDFETAFSSVDLLVSPVAPNTAFKIGEKDQDPLELYMQDILTVPASLAGVPALSLPCGFSNDNLPIGMQLIAPHFHEETLLNVAQVYQEVTDWHLKKPDIGKTV